MIFRNKDSKLIVERHEKFGGTIIYSSYEELEKDYSKGILHPVDLKNGVANALIELLEPARKHFSHPKVKKMWEDMEKLLVTT